MERSVEAFFVNDYTLILNAAEARIQIVLSREGTFVCAEEWSAPSQGTELLTPVLADMLRRLNMRPKDITRIACVAGPGSFTGLRLVLTTAAAFRRVTGAEVAALSTLHALAASLPGGLLPNSDDAVRVRVVTHARRGLVHGQDFLCGSGLPIPVGEPAMWQIETACMDPLPRFMIGSGVARNLNFFRERLAERKECRLLPGDFDQPTPRALLALTAALPETAWERQDITPLYLRPCDAVDNLASIAGKRGQNPEEAYAELNRLLAPISPAQIH